jgi:putative transcriptional regulator
MASTLSPSLLVAMPDLADPNFRRTVILVVHNDADGTVGLVLNRATDLSASDLCETLDVEWPGDEDWPVCWGGPVQPNTGWVVAGGGALGDLPDATPFAEGLHFAGSLDALRRVAAERPAQLRLFLGYAGWGPGQLEGELAAGAWVLAPLDLDAVFEVPADELWTHTWRLLGIDPATIVSTPGVH